MRADVISHESGGFYRSFLALSKSCLKKQCIFNIALNQTAYTTGCCALSYHVNQK